MAEQTILTISEATKYIKAMMEEDALLQDVWLRGELSNVKLHSRGHLYFTIKDAQSRMQAVMFAGHNRYLAFKPEDGMNVLLRGEVNVYEPFGQYQFYAKEMQPDGIGSLYLAYESLKAKLEQEGLFASERKKPLPTFPKRIAVITSPTGAAIRDIYTTLKRRYPLVQITLFPVLVQGDRACHSIVTAILQAQAANCFDVMIVGRGGGSIEELWAFNEEEVARVIAACPVPIISAIGHETDYTISDFVADLRAPTPTAAAELAVPDQEELLRATVDLERRLIRALNEQVGRQNERLIRLRRSYAFRYPEQLIRQKEQQLDQMLDRLKRAAIHHVNVQAQKLVQLKKGIERLHPARSVKEADERMQHVKKALTKAMKDVLQSKRQPFEKAIGELQLLSPLRVMERGYSVVYDQDEKVIHSIAQVKTGSELKIRIKDGHLDCIVEGKKSLEEGQTNDRETGAEL